MEGAEGENMLVVVAWVFEVASAVGVVGSLREEEQVKEMVNEVQVQRMQPQMLMSP
jgi:hypothetical protein